MCQASRDDCLACARPVDSPTKEPLTFRIEVTLDGRVDHREGIADDETHAFFTRVMDEGEALLWGRTTYEMMESQIDGRPSPSGALSSSRGTRDREHDVRAAFA